MDEGEESVEAPAGLESGGVSPLGWVQSFLQRWRTEAGIATGLVGLCIAWSFTAPHFLTTNNMRIGLEQASILILIALGETVTLLCGEIDLAVGSMAGLSSVVFASLVVQDHVPVAVAVVAVLAMGAASGLVMGALRVIWNVPSFITSLGLLSVYEGVSLFITGGASISPLPTSWSTVWTGSVLGIPAPIVIAFVAVVVLALVLSFTPYGRHLYAVGGNPRAARRYGISVRGVRVSTLMISEMLGVVAGLVVAAELSAGDASVGSGFELLGIAGAVVGGISLFGGIGSVVGTLIGVLFIAAVQDGLTLIGVSTNVFLIAEGALVVLAVWWGALQRRSPAAEE